MTPLSRIKQAGFEVSLYGDALKIVPSSKLTQPQREFLKSHKAELIAELKAEQAVDELKAEQVTTAIKVYCYRVTDKPNSELTIITHGKPLAEVREGLLARYGDRLITVYETMTMPDSTTKH